MALSSNVLHPTVDSFDDEVGGSLLPVLVDFWAPWCPPCRMQKPVVERLAGDLQGKARVAFVNVDEQPELAQRFGVQSIPAMMIVRDGRIVDTMVGFAPREELLERLELAGQN